MKVEIFFIFVMLYKLPEYVGGEKKLFEFMAANIKYPVQARESGVSGNEEVLRMMSIMPDWIPGKDGGRPVSVLYNLPVNFNLKTPEIKKDK